jgi:hypothetical protein
MYPESEDAQVLFFHDDENADEVLLLSHQARDYNGGVHHVLVNKIKSKPKRSKSIPFDPKFHHANKKQTCCKNEGGLYWRNQNCRL